MNDLENIKNKIDALKVKKLAAQSQVERLNNELNEYVAEIKKDYGVQIKDFAEAIKVMKEEYEKKYNELVEMVGEVQKKVQTV